MENGSQDLEIATLERIDQLCLQFEQAYRDGQRPAIEAFLRQIDGTGKQRLLIELILLEQDYRGQSKADYLERFPEASSEIEQAFHTLGQVSTTDAGSSTKSFREVEPSVLMDSSAIADRYVLLEKIGAGAFATVYRANDQSLKREVAVKIPHRIGGRNHALDQFLSEARMLARLDHRSIVPVFDTGKTKDERIYIVTKLISGVSLEQLMNRSPISIDDALDIIAQSARALDHAHRRGLIHRDLKPSNLLLDSQNQVFVTDFGLALDLYSPNTDCFVGTPAYMSPEQASGESHLVDHRSDIFSLGAIFYQLLTGKRPFEGASAAIVLDKVRTGTTSPVSRVAPKVPLEIERICMKAMAPQIMQRYGSAADIAKEIDQFRSSSTDSISDLPNAEKKILPKGLSSFDQFDAAGFIQLLPGPRDRNGLPENLSFWKQRIESRDQQIAFRIGLLTGPSGSGKSSLIKAGLIPQLNDGVKCLFFETEPTGTEERLLTRLQSEFTDLVDCSQLVDAMARLRQRTSPVKCLLVLDQFEQQLSHHEALDGLIKALRQCDGINLQCLLIVRDDFGMATTRLMQQLEARIEQGKNFSSVDLFSIDHARHVLAEFANALEKSSADKQPLDPDDEFIVTAVDRLAEDGQVIAVKLSLFSDLVRDRDWDRQTLDSFGNLTDLGISFLDQNLGTGASHPVARNQSRAIQEILEALLVSRFAQIKGGAVGANRLAAVCGLKRQSYEFSEIIDYMENQLRVISRVEYDEVPGENNSKVAFQLTHDFLVPSVRQWMDDQKRSTRKGRIKLLLQQLSFWWNNEPVNRRLPSMLEWAQIHWLVPARNWSQVQHRMMSSANGYYFRFLAFLFLLFALVFSGWWVWSNHQRASQLVSQISTSDVASLPDLLAELPPLRFWAKPELNAILNDANASCRKPNVLLASFLCDPSNSQQMIDELLCSKPDELKTISRILSPHNKILRESVEQRAIRETGSKKLNAMSLLAQLDPASPVFQHPQDSIIANLLGQNAVDLPFYVEMLQPAQEHLSDELLQYFDDDSNPTAQQISATVLARFSSDHPESLANLVRSATSDQLKTLLPFLVSERTPLTEIFQSDWETYLETVPLTRLKFSNTDRQRLQLISGFQKNWLLALRVPESELDSLNRRIENAGMKLSSKIRHHHDSNFFTAFWGTRITAELQTTTGRAESDPFEITINQVGSNSYPDRSIQIYVKDEITSGEELTSFLGDAGWISRIESSGSAPYGWLKRTDRSEFPNLDLSALAEFTIEAWVSDWRGVLFSQGILDTNENCIWMTLASEKDQEYSFGWTVNHGRKTFSKTLRISKPDKLRHVALVFDGKNQRLFLDGEIVYEQVAEAVGKLMSDRAFNIGLHEDGESRKWGSGQLIDFRVSDTCRYVKGFTPRQNLQRDRHSLFQISARSHSPETASERNRRIRLQGLDENQLSVVAESLASRGYVPESISLRSPNASWRTTWRQKVQLIPAQWEQNGTINSAIALWKLTDASKVLPALLSTEDQTVRTSLIVNLSKVGVDPEALLQQIRQQKDASIRQGLVLIMSSLGNQSAPISIRKLLLPELLELFEKEQDGAVRAAYSQLMVRWRATEQKLKIENKQALNSTKNSDRTWVYSPQQQLMSIIDIGEHSGASAGIALPSRLAVAIHETNNEQFLEYQKSKDPEIQPRFRQNDWKTYPRRSISWFEVASYCNWLSQRDGIPESQWCFEISEDGCEIPADYLSRHGYRLPTISEWQWFASAKSKTPFCFGRDEKYLSHFAWSAGNSEHGPKPVGQLLPNAFGLFDVHGNLREWVVDFRHSKPATRTYDMGYVCGGSYGHIGPLMQLDSVHTNYLRSPSVSVGLRIVRTIEPAN